MMIQNMITASIRWTGSCLLGGGILWHVASLVGPTEGEVVIHVTEVGAVVTVDGLPYRSDPDQGSSIVCNLPVGTHTLRTYRGEQLIQEENFTINPGNDVVLTAHDPSAYEGKPTQVIDPRR
ncbi:hypothetical protein P12x_003743 [Tundrisphaera lichenicola]|uniref:hypothetical protein n=1 Tax=Tundrisphaera lichenicola TaxID=2029860 RepID=UPI003EB8C015